MHCIRESEQPTPRAATSQVHCTAEAERDVGFEVRRAPREGCRQKGTDRRDSTLPSREVNNARTDPHCGHSKYHYFGARRINEEEPCRQFDARAPSLPTQPTESPLTRRTSSNGPGRHPTIRAPPPSRGTAGARNRRAKPSPQRRARSLTSFLPSFCCRTRALPSSGGAKAGDLVSLKASVPRLCMPGYFSSSKGNQ